MYQSEGHEGRAENSRTLGRNSDWRVEVVAQMAEWMDERLIVAKRDPQGSAAAGSQSYWDRYQGRHRDSISPVMCWESWAEHEEGWMMRKDETGLDR